jgi:hypothetical protein
MGNQDTTGTDQSAAGICGENERSIAEHDYLRADGAAQTACETPASDGVLPELGLITVE